MVVPEAVALEIPAEEEGSPPRARVPPRIRRRLLRARDSGGRAPTAEEIEAKLREAHLRRQVGFVFSLLPQKEDRGQLLEAKLVAAKQKRLSLLAKEQSRLAKLDELRQAVKNDAETRFEREREELGMRVESRARQAEKNRTELLHARSQRRAALEERTKKFFVQRLTWENKYRERVRSAILQKRTSAEKKRSGLLESEKRRAQGRLLQVQLAAKTASSQRETERSKLKEQLEDKLQRAKQQRAEYLKQGGTPQGSMRSSLVKSGEFLSRKLASGQGEREKLLMDSATNFVKEFELLVKTILDALDGACILRQSELDVTSPGCSSYEDSSSIVADRKKFRTQLVAFDKAWCAYLYHFVAWKSKDAESLEQDLIRAACKLELSMIQTCKITNEGQSDNLGGNLKAIQKQFLFIIQVAEDQKLLRERIQHLGGEAGIGRMESALSETRSKFFQAKDRSSIATTVANIASPSVACSSGQSTVSELWENSNMDAEKTSQVVKSLFGSSSSPSDSSKGGKLISSALSSAVPEKMPTENEQIVNEILHDIHGSFAAISDDIGTVKSDFKAKVKETMEKAFWDVVADSMRGDMPDYSYLVSLVKEVKEALRELAPTGWKEEISENINLEILTQLQPLVATLRTGLAVPGQLQSAIPAADNTELPECMGERLGRLIRIGLLQLISNTEGVQSQSVPETFMLNWLRLRSVQSKFQQVIVIATSMLVLHQVLASENPKITPSELENATLELFNMLTRLLDNFSDVGTEKIIEAMMYSIHSSTSMRSNEMMETRKQILIGVFLKSLQTGDTVFKKVSQSVYCAFRAITLGGSGEKGRKLADASLRRIGATKLTERVVKAAEVIVKAAVVSEQVHGPWYQQLL
ncbi:hypothetical protein BAE44_0014485 [Dichanthelium oligosanthes]|uniref:T-complex protein 11-like protein 1 n=1 Tax=Dichanthelium oligosanthes TaxID=888268 RepID=A0A1E5VHB1_9POAL|nr:hypothetical protein BAE44_0014485 [Dichanthelium oligosanthes]